MSSIKEKDKDLLAESFFNEVLVPLARACRAEGKQFFPLKADAEEESYYVEPRRRVMAASDFELRAADSMADFVRELSALWISEGNAELAGMATALLALAAELREPEAEGADDVSPFMYVMF
jgi:hypothetical protein